MSKQQFNTHTHTYNAIVTYATRSVAAFPFATSICFATINAQYNQMQMGHCTESIEQMINLFNRKLIEYNFSISGFLDTTPGHSHFNRWQIHVYKRSTLSNSISSRTKRMDDANQMGTNT